MPSEARLNSYLEFLRRMPRRNQAMFRRVIGLLGQVALNAKTTKMTTKNLAYAIDSSLTRTYNLSYLSLTRMYH
jgi:hypothetical protein